MNSIKSLILVPFAIAWAIVSSPFRLFVMIRRAMTGASVAVLLTGIISLNIVWGYPWTGMFGAAIALGCVGFGINLIMRPRLRVSYSLPNSVPAGELFTLTAFVANHSALPAMDLFISFARNRKSPSNETFSDGSSHPVSLIGPQSSVDICQSGSFANRGIQKIPDLNICSMFPFYLFESRKIVASQTTLAITPLPASKYEDAFSREMLSALGGWSHQLLAGCDLDYTGSREYQTGMSVRRWDFASWARIGRPIVREYQSPSIQSASLIVDTFAPRTEDDERFEFILSLAASAVERFSSTAVVLGMYLTSESSELAIRSETGLGGRDDRESMLIRLAQAQQIDEELADQRLNKVLATLPKSPVLILTTRPNAKIWDNLPPNVTVLRVDHAHPITAPHDSTHSRNSRRQLAKETAQ